MIGGVSKANLIIVVLGLGACLLLSWFMSRAVAMSPAGALAVVAGEVDELLGPAATAPSKLQAGDTVGGKIAVLRIELLAGFGWTSTARRVGDHVWRRLETEMGLVEVVVACRGPAGGSQRYQVWHPRVARSPRLQADPPVVSPK